jgi:hypothetical protein
VSVTVIGVMGGYFMKHKTVLSGIRLRVNRSIYFTEFENWKERTVEKPIEEWSFDALITGGAARMRTEFYPCFNVIVQWQKEQKQKKNK